MSSSHNIFAPHGTFSPAQLLPLLLILPLVVFWIWMFRDMLDNNDLSPDIKENWTWAFIFLNVFAAVIYYANVYRFRRKR